MNIDINNILNTEPPALRWLMKDLIPCGVAGLIAGTGGAGKSYFTLSLAMNLAIGRYPFNMGFSKSTQEPKRVLCVGAEDNRDEVHRRIKKIISAEGELTDKQKQAMSDNLKIITLDSMNTALLEYSNKSTEPTYTPTYSSIKNEIEEFKPDLIIIDPASRFSTGDESDNRIAIRFIQCLESLKNAGGEDTTLLFTHHTRKDKVGSLSDVIRGASALKDSSRWALFLQYVKYDKDGKLIDDNAKPTEKKPLQKEVKGEIVCKLAKSNYTALEAFDLILDRQEKNKGALTLNKESLSLFLDSMK